MQKSIAVCLLCTVVALGLVSCQLCSNSSESKKAAGEEPLLLLDSKPLVEAASSGENGADNSRCHVCHLNYSFEELAVNHANKGVGCEDCHGSSNAHCSDEDNITPPDIIYPPENINPTCLRCHQREDLPRKKHQHIFAQAQTDKPTICTECHGEHRLAVRTRIWDKHTRELLQDDKVRMMTDEMLSPESE